MIWQLAQLLAYPRCQGEERVESLHLGVWTSRIIWPLPCVYRLCARTDESRCRGEHVPGRTAGDAADDERAVAVSCRSAAAGLACARPQPYRDSLFFYYSRGTGQSTVNRAADPTVAVGAGAGADEQIGVYREPTVLSQVVFWMLPLTAEGLTLTRMFASPIKTISPLSF